MPTFKSAGLRRRALAISFIAVAIANWPLERAHSIRIDTDDFQVSTRALYFKDEANNVETKLYTTETYSAALKAGRVYAEQMSGKFLELGLRRRWSFHYTELLGANRLMQVSRYDPNCRLITGAQLARKLFANLDLEDSEEQRRSLPNLLMVLPPNEGHTYGHIFGLARLLLLFDNFRAQFQPHKFDSARYLKNHLVHEFKMSLQTDHSGQIEVLAQVEADGHRSDELGADRMPLRMKLAFPWRAQLVVDFNWLKRQLQFSSSTFNLPIGRGCSQWLVQTLDPFGAPPEQLRAHSSEIFSFKFELRRMNSSAASSTRIQSSFVAYDGQLGVMRLESMQPPGARRPKHELTIHDLNLGVKFHVSNGDGETLQQQNLLDSRPSDSTGASLPICTKTKMSKLELLPCEPIVPPSGYLAKMGASQVRGIESLMYESRTRRLPRAIFEPVRWFDQRRREQSASDELTNIYTSDNATATTNQPDFRLVYHLATAATHSDERPADKLLRIDVYDSEARHRYQVEVYDFQWSLAEAPNGDSRQGLFTLSQRGCEPANSWQYLAEMQIELRPTSGTFELAKLEHSPRRVSELVRGVSAASSSISASQILDVSSQLVGGGKVRAALKLLPGHLLNGPPLIRVLAVGSGLVRPERIGAAPSEQLSLAECFWEATAVSSRRAGLPAPQTSAKHIGVFSFCFRRCWIDPEAKLVPKREVNESELVSDVFQMSQAKSKKLCQLFALEQQVSSVPQDSTSSWPIELQLDEWRSQLEDKTIELAGESFKVTGVQLGLASSSEPLVELADSSQFEGVALVDPSSEEEEQNVERPPTVWRPAKARVHSFEHCQSECIASATCRSYSFCLMPNGSVECLLASYELMKPPLRFELRSRMERSKQATGRISIEFENDTSNYEFKLSKRCRLVAKQARDLFQRADGRTGGRGAIYVDQIYPVSSQEQCAEMCLAKNARYFQRLARFRVDIEAPSGGGPLNKSPESHDRHLDTLRYWCDRYKYLSLRGAAKRSRQLRDQLKGLGSKELQDKMRQPEAFGLCYLARGKWARSDMKTGQRKEKQPQQQQQQERVAAREESKGTSGRRGAQPDDGAKPSARPTVSSEQPKLVSIEMDVFQFRYDVLYERQEGFRLNGSKSYEAEFDPNQAKWVNEQTILQGTQDVGLCARKCFTQSLQWCRSFDVIHVSSSAFYCVFNSFGFREALKMAGNEANWLQIRQAANATERFEHFEPLDGYTLDIVELNVIDDEQQDVVEIESEIEASSSSNSLQAIICALAGLITGLALALLVVVHYERRQERLAAVRPTIPEVNLARLSFSLPVGADLGRLSLLSQDQLELRHNANESERD